MSEQRIFWDYEEYLGTILAKGDDPLGKLSATVDFERFRPILEKAAGRPRGAKGGRPALDVVLKFKMLVLQSLHSLSLEATEHMVRDRLSWLHFCGLKPHDTVPDANTLWDFREALIKAGVLDELFDEMNRIVAAAGFISRSGQVVDSSLVAAPRQRMTGEEKAAVKEGRSASDIWPDAPAKASQKDTDARWTVKHKKAKAKPDGRKLVDIAIPVFGYKTPHRHRQEAWDHPPPDRDGRRRERRQAASRRPDRPRQHLPRRVGGHGVSLGGEREVAEGERAEQPHPPQEAARPARCPRGPRRPTGASRRTGRRSSMSSPTRRPGWG